MLPSIDWTRPWFATVLPARRQLDLQRDTVIAALNARARALDLRNPTGLPLAFVPQADLPEGVAYEEFIGATGGVPTRDNLHDFFNALVWLTFPRIKRQLNALQAAQIALSGVELIVIGRKSRVADIAGFDGAFDLVSGDRRREILIGRLSGRRSGQGKGEQE